MEEIDETVKYLSENRCWKDGHKLFYVLTGSAETDSGELMVIQPCFTQRITTDNYDSKQEEWGYVNLSTGGDGGFSVWEVYSLNKKIQTDNLPQEYRVSIQDNKDNFYTRHSLTKEQLFAFFDNKNN